MKVKIKLGDEYDHVVDKAVSIIVEDEELFVFSKDKEQSKRYLIDNVYKVEVII